MKKFQRKIENFTCQHCGLVVLGDGFTNHCPRCLWSKHVDVNPGDRTNDCGGMMQPMRFELDHGKQILIHKCEKCGMEKRNKIAKNDSTDAIIGLAKKANF